jgi:U3 small nucleolar RNA-associated protein 13
MVSDLLVESLDARNISRAFYTGGLLLVGVKSDLLYSLNVGSVSIVDPKSGQTRARIEISDDPIFCFAINPVNNNEIVTIGKSNLCRHWIISGPHEVSLLRAWSSGHLHPALSIDISFDGSLVATSSVDKCIKVFSLVGYYSVSTYRVAVQDPISIIRFIPKLKALVSLGNENSLLIWDLEETSRMTPLRELKGHMSSIHDISFSPDGTTMLSSGNDQMVISWDITSLHEISVKSQVAVFESVRAVLALSNDSFVTAGDKGLIRVWKGRKCVCSVSTGHAANGLVKYLHKLGNTGEIIAVGADLGISLWSVDSNNSSSIKFNRQLLGNMGEILSMKWMDGGSHLAVAVNDEFVRIIDSSNFSAIAKLEGHSDIVLAVAVRGNLIATGSKDQTIRVWDASDNYSCIAEMVGHTGPVNAVVLTKRGEDGEENSVRLLSVSEDGCVKVWRCPKKQSKTGKKKFIIRSIVAHSKAANAIAVSGNDKWLASGSQDRTAKVFSVDDGSLVATCSGHKGSIWGVDFSPIEQVLATSSRDGTVKLWNLSTPGAPCIRTFEGHEQSVMGCRFLPSGLQLVSADSLGTTRVWNVRTGECPVIAMLNGEVIQSSEIKSASSAIEDFAESESSAKIWTFDISHDDRGKAKIACGTNNGTISIWRDNTEELTEERRREKAEIAEKDTSVQVLMKAGRYSDALKNAFALNRPKLMVEIIRESVWKQQTGASSINIARFVAQNVSNVKSAEKLVSMVQEWQKTSKTCAIAYQLVEATVAAIGDLIGQAGLDVSKFEGFAEKHLARLTGLSQKCFIIDAILLASDSNVQEAMLE